MDKIKIEKTIYIRDKFKVKRQAFVAGQEVEKHVYDAVLSSNAVVNPEDLPKQPVKNKFSKSTMETKMLDAKEVVVKSEESPVVENAEEAAVIEDAATESVATVSSEEKVVKKPKSKKKTED